MADCSKTEDYFAEHDRMCGCAKNCDACPFSIDNNDFGMPCDDYEREHTKDAIIALQKWSDAHPRVAKDDGDFC